jgi:ATP-dependent DNA ligase
VLHAFPEPMLCRSAPLPRGSGWAFEVRWDGIRAIVDTRDRFRASSRRGWDMTAQVRELAALPARLVLRRHPHRDGRARDDHLAVLERLAQRLERRPRELGQLVEEEHAAMRQRSGMSLDECGSRRPESGRRPRP